MDKPKRYLLARHEPSPAGHWTLTQYYKASTDTWTRDDRDASKYHEDDLKPILEDVREQFAGQRVWAVEI